ncbi:MAG: hypothetical protein HQL54_13245 [Magnetococcales bacterium]|nr:hypothetical protein [Magnetococcales bacterium]
MDDIQQPEKSEVVRLLLELEGRVMLCLDATRKEVEVPRRFVSDPGLRLILNSKMPQPIEITEKAIESELRFSGIPHYCVIPYGALWGAFNPDTGHGMFWPNSMPKDIRENLDMDQAFQLEGLGTMPMPNQAELKPADLGRKAEKKPVLQVLDGGLPKEKSTDGSSKPDPDSPKPGPGKGKGFLKLVE